MANSKPTNPKASPYQHPALAYGDAVKVRRFLTAVIAEARRDGAATPANGDGSGPAG